MIANAQCNQLQQQIATYEEQDGYHSSFGSSQFDVVIRLKQEPGYLSRYSDSLRARRFKDRIEVGQDFSHPSSPVLSPNQPPIQLVPGLSLGVKRPGRGIYHLPSSRVEVRETV